MSNVTVNKGIMNTGGVDSRGFKHIGKSERITSMIAGTTLASSALRSRSLLSAALILGASAGMLYRGATGKCCFSKGINTLNDMMNGACSRVSDRSDRMNSEESHRTKRHDEVAEASEDSFPASDSPSFTPVTGEAEAQSHMNM